MTLDEQPRTIQTIADAGADSITRWRASKRALRMNHYRRRMEQVKEPAPVAWLAAVERDDQAERELVLEEQAA
jgi:hypothetical protein